MTIPSAYYRLESSIPDKFVGSLLKNTVEGKYKREERLKFFENYI